MSDPRPGTWGWVSHRAARPVLILALLLPLLPGGALTQEGTPATQTRPLEIQDLFQIKRVGAPVVSPDGEWVAYTVSNSSLDPEESETRIWMVSTDGGDPLAMTGKGYSASSPQWSPDGKYLSFLASRGDSAKT
ncbi:MAG: hypothetical protein AMS18_11390, partial [Gemmatimonas sp. SG8_17]